MFFLQEEKAKVIQTLLFVAGINTLVQTLFGSRLPAVIGGSYTFVPATISIILAGRFNDEPDPIEVLYENISSYELCKVDMSYACWVTVLYCNEIRHNLNREHKFNLTSRI
jgi:F0F1-type ATP synthase assembly protein I